MHVLNQSGKDINSSHRRGENYHALDRQLIRTQRQQKAGDVESSQMHYRRRLINRTRFLKQSNKTCYCDRYRKQKLRPETDFMALTEPVCEAAGIASASKNRKQENVYGYHGPIQDGESELKNVGDDDLRCDQSLFIQSEQFSGSLTPIPARSGFPVPCTRRHASKHLATSDVKLASGSCSNGRSSSREVKLQDD